MKKKLIMLSWPISLIFAFVGGNLIVRENTTLIFAGIITIAISVGLLAVYLVNNK